jgi:hypothetical protein
MCCMRRIFTLGAVLIASGALLSVALAAPPTKAPKRPQGGPPPAWIETARGDKWLSFGTYCWGTVCADMIAPRCSGLGRVVHIPVRRGEVTRIHLGFATTNASVISVPTSSKGAPRQRALGKGKVLRFKVDRFGPIAIFTAKKGGSDASYTACLVRAG